MSVAARLAALAAASCVAIVAAALVRRRREDAPTQGGHRVPVQLDRRDFASSDAPWLVVAFTSATCATCEDVAAKVSVLATDQVGASIVEWSRDRDLHSRYGIDSVPTVVVADADGVVRAAFVGPVKAQDLWAAVAECREPGSSPRPGEGCGGGSRVV